MMEYKTQNLFNSNTHHRGRITVIADLLFDWFVFDQTSKTVANST